MRLPEIQRGLSLIELMLAMGLGLLLISGATSIFTSSKQGFRLQDSSGRMQENARHAMNYLAQTLRSADLWSGVNSNAIKVGSHSIAGPRSAKNCNAEWIANPADGLHGYEGALTPPIDCLASADYVPYSDIVVIRRVDPNSFTTPENVRSAENRKRNYVRIRVGADGYLYQGNQIAVAEQQIPSGAGVFNYDYDFQLLFLRPCHVKTGGLCKAKNALPTLVSLQLQTDGSVTQVPLVDNVEQIQFEYGVDDNTDLIVDQYQNADAVAAWNKVISVRASIIVRGDVLDRLYDKKTYHLTGEFCYGPASSTCQAKYTGYERHQRRLVTKDILIRNRVRT